MRVLLARALWGTPAARIYVALLLSIALAAVFGPAAIGIDPEAIDWDALEAPPSANHWFGTDAVGRDLLVRTLTGARVSLGVALIATAVAVLIGVPWGALAGYAGGRVDQLMMRIVDVLYAMPFIFVVILLVVVFGREPLLLYLGLGAISWLDLARIVRGQTLKYRAFEFVNAARLLGAPTRTIVLRHLVPNTAGPAVVYASLTVPGVILAESFISFLGLGVQEPDTSWGVLIADGAQNMTATPWALVFPAAFLCTTIWCCNMLGDRLRDALDDRQGTARHGAQPTSLRGTT